MSHRSPRRRCFAPLLLLCLSLAGETHSASAQFSAPLPSTAQLQGYQLAKVTPGPPVPFYVGADFKPGCPAKVSHCLDISTLAAGSVVVIRSRNGDLAQVESKEVRFRYIPTDRLQILPVSTAPSLEAWIGVWHYYDDSLRIKLQRNGTLLVSGSAFWHGQNDDTHLGDLDAQAAPHGNTLELAEDPKHPDACRVDLVLLGTLLYAQDNGACGGMNVRFDGFYHRRAITTRNSPRPH